MRTNLMRTTWWKRLDENDLMKTTWWERLDKNNLLMMRTIYLSTLNWADKEFFLIFSYIVNLEQTWQNSSYINSRIELRALISSIRLNINPRIEFELLPEIQFYDQTNHHDKKDWWKRLHNFENVSIDRIIEHHAKNFEVHHEQKISWIMKIHRLLFNMFMKCRKNLLIKTILKFFIEQIHIV
jgi:hypothetical protein